MADIAEKCVLVVDDHEFVRETIVRAISDDYSARIDTANDGQEAVDMAHLKQYDLIVMDASMPRGLGGLEATSRIRGFNLEVPIYLHTFEELEEQDWKPVGATGCIDKAEGPDGLRPVLDQYLEHKI